MDLMALKLTPLGVLLKNLLKCQFVVEITVIPGKKS